MAQDILLELPKTAPFPTVWSFNVIDGETQYLAPLGTSHAIINFRGNASGTTLSSLLDNKMIVCRLLLRNGSKAFIPQTFFVDGVAHYPDFLNGIWRKSATGNRMLELTFKFYKVGSSVFSLLSYAEYAPADKRATPIINR